jgi:hypothetical protein
MSYFELLPNVEYPNPLPDRVSNNSYLKVKNIFRRVKLRDDLIQNLALFNSYEIQNDDRPDIVAEKVYGDPNLDWLVLICAGVVSIRDQWPMTDQELYDFCVEKYGLENITAPARYETIEVRDSQKRLIYPAGVVVDSDFTITDPENLTTLNPVRSVTNYELERIKNDDRRLIQMLRPIYVEEAVNDIREQLFYDKSSQFIDRSLIRSDNVRILD